MPWSEIKTDDSMNQNTAQTQPSITCKFNITLPRESLNTQRQTTKHQTHAHIHFWTNGKHPRSQSSHHMKLPSFYHTIVHDNDSVNEMPKVAITPWTQPSAQLPIRLDVSKPCKCNSLQGVLERAGRLTLAARCPGAGHHRYMVFCLLSNIPSSMMSSCTTPMYEPVQPAPPIHTWLQEH